MTASVQLAAQLLFAGQQVDREDQGKQRRDDAGEYGRNHIDGRPHCIPDAGCQHADNLLHPGLPIHIGKGRNQLLCDEP